jgi:ubiquinone/menaquinone biosynthesis C-methylase UbiE
VHQTSLLLGRRILPQAGAVLDVGCGTGRLLRAARPCYPAAELVEVDLAGQMVAAAMAVGMAEVARVLRPSGMLVLADIFQVLGLRVQLTGPPNHLGSWLSRSG